MFASTLTEDLLRAEGLLVNDENEEALELLARLAEDAEEYVDRNCSVSEEEQWFSFPGYFEELLYRHIEKDPRTLHDIEEPLDQLYAELALAQVKVGDYDAAIEALKQACRWNPVECGYRLDLADLFRVSGNMEEFLALSQTVFARASVPVHLVRAYLNFANWFEVSENPACAAACLRAAKSFGTDDELLRAALDLAAGTERDPETVSDEEARELLAAEGLEYGANVEVAICMLMAASAASAQGDGNEAANLMLRARDLIGEEQVEALLSYMEDASE